MVGFFNLLSPIANFYLVLDPTRKTTYVDVAWDAVWVEAYIDWLQDIVRLLTIPEFSVRPNRLYYGSI